jgi:chromosomal replication initiator protein
VVVASSEAFAHERQRAQRSGGLLAFRIRYGTAGFAVFEDVHQLVLKRSAQDELASLLDALAATGALVIVTSCESISSLDHLDVRLRSRLASGLVLSLSPPGRLARQAISLQLAASVGVPLSEHRAFQLADSNQVSVQNLLNGVLSTEVPAPESHRNPPRGARLPIERIIRSVCRQFALTSDQVTGPSRKKTVVLARSIAMYLSRTATGRSFEQIGEAFGGRDHTTVLYNVRKISRLERTDVTIRTILATLRRSLSAEARK